MKKIILIMGLPGSGKTTLANSLYTHMVNNYVTVTKFNADEVRESLNDWDFSYEGRLRQARRMHEYSTEIKDGIVIIDMVAPLPEFRQLINPNIIIWVDTIKESRYLDTNAIFVPPEYYNFHVTEQESEKWSVKIFEELNSNIVELITTVL